MHSNDYAQLELIVHSTSNYSIGNSANFKSLSQWNNSSTGNVTSVGSNGDSSYYGLYDMAGQVYEWTETVDSNNSSNRILRGGCYMDVYPQALSKTNKKAFNYKNQIDEGIFGFRVATINNLYNYDNFVTVEDHHNLSDDCPTYAYGSVHYNYQMSKYLVTNAEYVAFLNNIHRNSDKVMELYDPRMGSSPVGGILFVSCNRENLFNLNVANFNRCADWNDQNGNVTTVGTNGRSSYYGTFDQAGNVSEWNDLDDTTGSTRGLRGGGWTDNAVTLSSSARFPVGPSFEFNSIGFRLASSFSTLNPLNLPNFVSVENSGNSNDSTGYGGVSYVYSIGKYVVTNYEYVEFLNAVASTDTYDLYDMNMGSDIRGGITRSGSSGSYSYSIKTNMGNKPVVYINWFDAARYCNWLHNNKPIDVPQDINSTEDGAYSLSGAVTGDAIAKNSNAKYHIPTENEWYKAAYYNPEKGGVGSPGYYDYATMSDADPACVVANTVGDGSTRASYVVKPNMSNKPVVFITWLNAAKYMNWLNYNKNCSFDQLMNGTYDLSSDSKQRTEQTQYGNDLTPFTNLYFLPSEDEWYKAAYYDPDNETYWKYPTQSDSDPLGVLCNSTGLAINVEGYHNSYKKFPITIVADNQESFIEPPLPIKSGVVPHISLSVLNTNPTPKNNLFLINTTVTGLNIGLQHNYIFTALDSNWPSNIEPLSGSFTPYDDTFNLQSVLKFCPAYKPYSGQNCNYNLPYNLDSNDLNLVKDNLYTNLQIQINTENYPVVSDNIYISTSINTNESSNASGIPLIKTVSCPSLHVISPSGTPNSISIYDSCVEYIPIFVEINNAIIGKEYTISFTSNDNNVECLPEQAIVAAGMDGYCKASILVSLNGSKHAIVTAILVNENDMNTSQDSILLKCMKECEEDSI